ncbi:MAG TPA: hypothetical protein VMN58_09760 [Acidimicrobiales bacterium]|nr:hypothetical protein [Acidimicrobiales bacterium]
MRSARSADDGEVGAGLIGTVFGVAAFLVLLLFAVQLVLNLYATTVVTAVSFDAARIVAGADAGAAGRVESEATAESFARGLLGRYEEAGRLDMTWDYDSDVVRLRVQATHPTRLLPDVVFPFQRVDRTITVRLEDFR